MTNEKTLLNKKDLIKGDLIIPKTEETIKTFRELDWINKTQNTNFKKYSPRYLNSTSEFWYVKESDLYSEEYHYKNNSYEDKDKVTEGYEETSVLRSIKESGVKYTVETEEERTINLNYKGFVISVYRRVDESTYKYSCDKKKSTSKYNDLWINGDYSDETDPLKKIASIKKYIDTAIENFEKTGSYNGKVEKQYSTITVKVKEIVCEVQIARKPVDDERAEIIFIYKMDGNILETSRESDYKHFEESGADYNTRQKKEIEARATAVIKRMYESYKHSGEHKQ